MLGEKKKCDLYLSEANLAGLIQYAEEHNISDSEAADKIIYEALERFRQEKDKKQKVRVLKAHLEPSLVNAPADHPIFGGKEPTMVNSRRAFGGSRGE